MTQTTELKERKKRVHVKGKCQCCDNLTRIADIEDKTIPLSTLEELEKRVEEMKHVCTCMTTGKHNKHSCGTLTPTKHKWTNKTLDDVLSLIQSYKPYQDKE